MKNLNDSVKKCKTGTLTKDELLPILEEATESSDMVKVQFAAKVLAREFLPEKESLLKKILEKYFYWTSSVEIVMGVYHQLEKIGTGDAKKMMEYIDNLYTEKYNVDREESILLRNLLIDNINVYRLGSDFGSTEFYLDFVPIEGKVKEIFIYNLNSVQFVNVFQNLKRLNIMSWAGTANYSYQNLSLPNLKILEINDDSLIDLDYLENIDACENLRELTLHVPHITEIKHLNKLKKLEKLTILGHERPGEKSTSGGLSKIRGLEGMTHLKELTIKNHEINDISGLKTLVNLEKLDLSDNNIEELKGVEGLKSLKIIKI